MCEASQERREIKGGGVIDVSKAREIQSATLNRDDREREKEMISKDAHE